MLPGEAGQRGAELHTRAVLRHPELSRDEAVSESNVVMFASTKGAEFREGVSSFMEKRKPNFPPFSEETPVVAAMRKWGSTGTRAQAAVIQKHL